MLIAVLRWIAAATSDYAAEPLSQNITEDAITVHVGSK